MKNFKREGEGTQWDGLITYAGGWKNNQCHGKGRIYSTNYEYRFPVNYDSLAEIGKCWVKYEGDFEHG